MTTIAYRNGIMAADSMESSDICEPCIKLYRVKRGRNKGHIVGTAGAMFSGMVFLDWYSGGRKHMPSSDRDIVSDDDDFMCLILRPDGLFKVNKSCRPVLVEAPFYAIGHGAGVALGAMEKGASARRAVEAACKWDPYTRGPIHTMRL